MILYLYENNVQSGRIANGNSTNSLINDFEWDSNNMLNPIIGSFYLKVYAEKYSKHFTESSTKYYDYPGIYSLKCYYDKYEDYNVAKTIRVTDCKNFLKILLIF